MTCCICGGPETPNESPGVGIFIEGGIEKYICLNCWARANYGPLESLGLTIICPENNGYY